MQRTVFLLIMCFAGAISSAEQGANEIEKELEMLPIELAVIEPVVFRYVSAWVPAVKSGPFINRSCRAQLNLSNASELSVEIDHQKESACPTQLARILAELASVLYEKELPLTIFNGWQWEYSYSLCQYENTDYDLSERGGSWEDCQEAILKMTAGEIGMVWLEVTEHPLNVGKKAETGSEIYLHTFSSMRTRDGYPKERKI